MEYPLISLKREFNNRLLNKLDFTSEEIRRIVYAAIKGYSALEKMGCPNDKVRLAHVFVGVHLKESLIKVVDSQLLTSPTNLQCIMKQGPDSPQHHDVYLAPEEFEAVMQKNATY
jgi:hypothetical protein